MLDVSIYIVRDGGKGKVWNPKKPCLHSNAKLEGSYIHKSAAYKLIVI